MATEDEVLMVDERSEEQIQDLGIIGKFFSYRLLPLSAEAELKARGIRFTIGNMIRMKQAERMPIYSLLDRRF